jgi:small-conductance mechanosensitive channel
MAAGRRTRRSLLDAARGPLRAPVAGSRRASRLPAVSWDTSWLDHPVILVGVASAALNFPETLLAAPAALSSAAVLAVIIGFAAQSTLSNLVADLVLALSHPIRLGDRVREVEAPA